MKRQQGRVQNTYTQGGNYGYSVYGRDLQVGIGQGQVEGKGLNGHETTGEGGEGVRVCVDEGTAQLGGDGTGEPAVAVEY